MALTVTLLDQLAPLLSMFPVTVSYKGQSSLKLMGKEYRGLSPNLTRDGFPKEPEDFHEQCHMGQSQGPGEQAQSDLKLNF